MLFIVDIDDADRLPSDSLSQPEDHGFIVCNKPDGKDDLVSLDRTPNVQQEKLVVVPQLHASKEVGETGLPIADLVSA